MTCIYCGQVNCAESNAVARNERKEIENVGYRPNDNASRWSWMRQEILRDGRKNPLCLELGSNFGYMSLNLAKSFPTSRIFSIEGSYGTGNRDGSPAESSPGVKKHSQIRKQFGLSNNIICTGLANNDLYERVVGAPILFDYLICLSVFHWTVDATPKGVDSTLILANLFRMARTTFIELPDMEQGKPLPGIYKDFATIPEAMQHAAKLHGLDIKITHLGACSWYGTRDTYRVDNLSVSDITQQPDCEAVINSLNMPVA